MKERITWWGMVVIGGWVAKDARQTRQEGDSLCTNATADRGTRICDVSHLPFTSFPTSTPHAPRNHLATNRKCTTAAGRRTSNDASYATTESDGSQTATATFWGVRPQRMSRTKTKQVVFLSQVLRYYVRTYFPWIMMIRVILRRINCTDYRPKNE